MKTAGLTPEKYRLRLMRGALTRATSRYGIGGNPKKLRPITLAGNLVMTQAWDFVDADVLWQQRRSLALDQEINQCDLSTRTRHALHNDQVFTVDDLIQKTDQELMRIPNFGRVSLHEVNTFLKKHGLRLSEYRRSVFT